VRRRAAATFAAVTVRFVLTFMAAAIALLAGAGVAMADSVAISVTTGTGQSDPVAHVPRVFTIAGATTTSKRLYIKVRPAGGASCTPTAITDPGRWISGFAGDPIVSGPFSFQRVMTWDASGAWSFCSWLAQSDSEIVMPLTQTIVFRPPTGTIDATISPLVPKPDQYAKITISGTTEAPAQVFAKVRAAGGAPCAPTYAADPGTVLRNGEDVEGTYATFPQTSQSRVGQYLICTWLMGAPPDTALVAGPVSRVFSVVQPPAVASALSPVNCATGHAVKRFRAGRIRSVCARYRFTTQPRNAAKVSVSFVAPSRRTWSTLGFRWRDGQSPKVTTGSLPNRAYATRRGVWRVILRVNGKQIRSTSFRVY
jgi:hypothetical protein